MGVRGRGRVCVCMCIITLVCTSVGLPDTKGTTKAKQNNTQKQKNSHKKTVARENEWIKMLAAKGLPHMEYQRILGFAKDLSEYEPSPDVGISEQIVNIRKRFLRENNQNKIGSM